MTRVSIFKGPDHYRDEENIIHHKTTETMTLKAAFITQDSRGQIIAYWIFTEIIALQSAAGAILDFSGDPDFAEITIELGYPPYLLIILGLSPVFQS